MLREDLDGILKPDEHQPREIPVTLNLSALSESSFVPSRAKDSEKRYWMRQEMPSHPFCFLVIIEPFTVQINIFFIYIETRYRLPKDWWKAVKGGYNSFGIAQKNRI